MLTTPLCPSHHGLTSFPAFAELQIDLHDVANVEDKNYPFWDFRTFAIRFLFPTASDDHIVLKPVQVASVMCLHSFGDDITHIPFHSPTTHPYHTPTLQICSFIQVWKRNQV